MMNGISVVLKFRGVRYQVNAYGPPAWRLRERLAGEMVRFTGECGDLTGRFARTQRIAHVVGRINVATIAEEFGEGSAAVRMANRMRRAMVRGVDAMPHDMRALFTGLVIGDDRDQPREMIQQFRASGLSHLTAVSGQNVAYLLAVLSPLLLRLRRGARWTATMAILMWFVLLTRAEPSVLRAAFMAGVVATNAAIGRKQNARVVLALTVIALLIIDPLLAWSVGFALSVGATAGLAWFSARLGKLVGGRGVAAATLAAQLGTAPVSLAVFGTVPVVSLLANPLALGVAGAVMMFGLPVALLAGVTPALVTPISWVLTVPVAYVAFVARMAAHISPHGLWNALLWACVPLWLWRRRRQSARRPTAVAG
jgi:competence protein ComEC